jgi:hypothetical protein
MCVTSLIGSTALAGQTGLYRSIADGAARRQQMVEERKNGRIAIVVEQAACSLVCLFALFVAISPLE